MLSRCAACGLLLSPAECVSAPLAWPQSSPPQQDLSQNALQATGERTLEPGCGAGTLVQIALRCAELYNASVSKARVVLEVDSVNCWSTVG
jgi:hypothetical protein